MDEIRSGACCLTVAGCKLKAKIDSIPLLAYWHTGALADCFYFPLNTGTRLSMKAPTASRRSSEMRAAAFFWATYRRPATVP
jgi:hypothetical protein